MGSDGFPTLIEYSFPVWIRLVPVLASAAFVGIAAFLFRKAGCARFAWVSLLFGVIAGGLFAPAIATDRIIVTSGSISHDTGFWFDPTHKEIVFTNVVHIERTTFRDMKGRKHVGWNVHHPNGEVSQIEHGDLWRLNSDDIEQRLRAAGLIIK